MLDEIHQQPGVVSGLVEIELNNARKLAADIKSRGIDFVILAARGTSDHAAIYGKYLLEIKNGLPVALADCSAFTLYDAKLRLERALVIGISQSGQATDVNEYLKRSKEYGALTVAITNEYDSPITKLADYTFYCHAEKELAVAATKTYTATLAILYLICAAVSGNDNQVTLLNEVSAQMLQALSAENEIKNKAERYRYMQSGAVLSRGYNFCTSLETALKLTETCSLGVRGYSAADFMHGPIAAIHDGEPCFIIAPPGKAYSMMLEVAQKLKSHGAESIIISSEDDILNEAVIPIKLNVDVPEELSPLVYIIPGQLFACHLSMIRGYNPDKPAGLNKVTQTR